MTSGKIAFFSVIATMILDVGCSRLLGQEASVRDVSPPGTAAVIPAATQTTTPTGNAEGSGGTQQPSDVSKKVDELAKALEAEGAADGLSSTQLAKLIALLEQIVKLANRPDPDRELISKLTAQLKDFNKPNVPPPGDPYAEALRLLANEADDLLLKKNAVTALSRLDGKISAAIAAAPNTDETVRNSLKNLLMLLAKSWPIEFLEKVNLQVQAIQNTIKVDKGIQAIIDDAPTRQAVAELYKALTPVGVAAQKHVHIVTAIYGDRRVIAQVLARGKPVVPGSLDRWCNATAAMRTRCENKASCTAPDNPTTGLCGYDPVPFVSPRYKTIVVFYRCLDSNVPDNWSGVLANPGLKNVFVPADERTNFSVSLWNNQQTIYCTAP